MNELAFTATIRLWSNGVNPASRHFVTVPKEISQKLRLVANKQPKKRGWGMVKVEVRIGYYKRLTSVFPEKDTGCYILPLKKEVRTSLHISEGNEIHVYLVPVANI